MSYKIKTLSSTWIPDGVTQHYDPNGTPYYRGIQRTQARLRAEFEKLKFGIDTIEPAMITPNESGLWARLKETQVQMVTYLNESERLLAALKQIEQVKAKRG